MRILSFSVWLFLPLAVVGVGVLIPVTWMGEYYARVAVENGISDAITSAFVRMTISNVEPGSPRLWWVCCAC